MSRKKKPLPIERQLLPGPLMTVTSRPRTHLPARALLGVSLAAACSHVFACKISGHDHSLTTIEIRQEAQPDVILSPWRSEGFGGSVEECQASQLLRVEFSPQISGLEHVRDVDVDGKSYAAYGWSPTSPLVIFRLEGSTFKGRTRLPLRSDQPTRGYFQAGGPSQPDQGKATVALQYALLSRGGTAMSAGAPPRIVGSTRMIEPASRGTVNHEHSFNVTVASPACTLTSRITELAGVMAAHLAHEGDTALEQAIDVHMECPFDGIGVVLSLGDAGSASNQGSELTPASGSTAGGVRLQVLRNGAPVKFHQTWVHGNSTKGGQVIPLSVRYRRTKEPLSAGLIVGEAVLKADYR
ncbi:fimbrial protein [Stenotrophomonas lacuserhaii]|uniref:fimbrial protein n=1 Tax=Stenotrophomonas lacuserhaii TaxID=2760084 RepID=UPI001CD82C9D|nr:fimbrial protein [Stenotrophomonas pennii]